MIDVLVAVFLLSGISALVALIWVRNREHPPPPGSIEAIREEYVAGEISLETFERRVEATLDPERHDVFEFLTSIHGIGPETAAALTGRFPTVDAIREASSRDLQVVVGVGPATASAIRDRLVADALVAMEDERQDVVGEQ